MDKNVRSFVLKAVAVVLMVVGTWLANLVLPLLPVWLAPWAPVILIACAVWILAVLGAKIDPWIVAISVAAMGYLWLGGWDAVMKIFAFLVFDAFVTGLFPKKE